MRHQLLTREIARSLPTPPTNGEAHWNEAIARVKFFTPRSSWTWYATEAEALIADPDTDALDPSGPGLVRAIPLSEAIDLGLYDPARPLPAYPPEPDGHPVLVDIVFFGLVDGFELERGYFALSDLEGAFVERDVHFHPQPIAPLEHDLRNDRIMMSGR